MSTLKIRLGRVKGSIWYTGTADSNTAIATALTSAGYTPIKLDMYLNTSNGNVYQYLPLDDGLQWILQGNLRGTKGDGFEIKKTYSSVAEMNESYDIDDVPLYGFVLINTGNVDDEENARLYVKGDTAYQFLTDLSGAQGIRGERGEKGDIGPEGLQGRGYYRANIAIDVASTTVARSNINPLNCKLLTSDTIVDSIGNCFAVTKNCDIGAETVYIAHRGYLGGANGKDGKDGLGVPAGGTMGQVLTKLSDEDNDTAWKDPSGGNTEQLTFGNATWDQIGRIAEAGESRKYFNIGDEKTIELSTGEKITLVILGFDHDDLTTGGKAGITIGIKNILSILYPMNNSATNEGGWAQSKMRAETMQMLLFQLPSDLRAIIKDVYKYELKNNKGNNVVDSTTTRSTLFLFARVEIKGRSEESQYWCEGEQYEYWRSVKNGEIPEDRIKSDQSWWLRTWYSDTESNGTFFAVTNEGNFELKNANTNCGVSFGFCIGNQSSDKYYSKPESGIPESDMSEEVQAKLNSGGGASYKVKQVSVSSGEKIYSVVDKITSAIKEELTAQSRSSAVVTVALNDLTISDAVMSGNSAGRVFLETSYMSITCGVGQNKIVFITPLVRAVGDSTSVWGSGSWAVTVQFGKFESNIIASTGIAVSGGVSFKDLSNFVSDGDTTIDIIIY